MNATQPNQIKTRKNSYYKTEQNQDSECVRPIKEDQVTDLSSA